MKLRRPFLWIDVKHVMDIHLSVEKELCSRVPFRKYLIISNRIPIEETSTKRAKGRAHAQFIIEYRELINRHLVDYLRITNYQRPDFVYAQRSAIIESTNIYTAYANSVHLRFGQHPRRVVNALLNTQQRIVDLRRVLSTQGMDDDEIKHRI
ncbi:hypothetical protein CU097_006834, partial [Rhizopus azygosporus]